ncbi:MAG: polysaccharide biosynthesis/export family protein [Terracidiphilus sp.]
MSKASNNTPKQMLRSVMLFAVLLYMLASADVKGQQSPSAVTANIAESSSTATRRPSVSSGNGLLPVPEGFEKLHLSPGYLLQMDVYDVPEMSTELRIDAQGSVTVPLAGGVHVEGDTVPEAQAAIAKVLIEKRILKDPQVTINVLQYSSKYVSVLGEVLNPGRLPLLAPESLEDVIALAGGETISASDDIEIQHLGENGEVTSKHVVYVQASDSSTVQNTLVEPGDTILVHRAGIIYVLGAVNRPGGYLMVNGGSLSVIQAVSLAGGITLQASAKWAVIVRRQGDGYVQFKVPLAAMETGGAAPIQLQANDALFVPLSTWKAVLISSSNVLSAATSAAIYRAP